MKENIFIKILAPPCIIIIIYISLHLGYAISQKRCINELQITQAQLESRDEIISKQNKEMTRLQNKIIKLKKIK